MTTPVKSSQTQKPKQKRASPSPKKAMQRSITSFFSATPRSTAPKNVTPSTTLTSLSQSPVQRLASKLSTPSISFTAPELRKSNYVPVAPAEPASATKGLRRTLFSDDADEELSVMRKRRRVLGDDDSNNEMGDSDDEMLDRPLVQNRLESVPRPKASSLYGKQQSRLPSRSDVFNRADTLKKSPASVNIRHKELQSENEDVPISTWKGAGNAALLSLKRSNNHSSEGNQVKLKVTGSLGIDKDRLVKAREKLAELSGAVKVGQEPNGWCENHSWSVNVRDSEMRLPSDPDYDKTTLYVPSSELSDARGAKSLSPFQKQFWRIKMKNYDVIIFFKKGKFYELYDVDADIGSSVLGLNYTKGGRVDMRCCGVPEQAFDKHCGRLIDLGYKVGRVEQTETANAAEKRKQSLTNTSAVCERSLVRILTKGTVREDGLLRDHRARYVVAITEGEPARIDSSDSNQSTMADVDNTERATDSSVTIGLCFVDVASGSISINQFEDDVCLLRTERLITCLAPYELVIDSSKSGQRLYGIVKWASRKFRTDVMDLCNKGGFKPMTRNKLASYLLHTAKSDGSEELMEQLQVYMRRYPVGSSAFGGLVSHLKSLIIDKETLSLANYKLHPDPDQEDNKSDIRQDDSLILATASAGRLYMDASALQNLEVLTSTMGTENGSLLSFVDRAHTSAGRRLIRKWLTEPLASSLEIEDRLNAIEDLHAIEDSDGGGLLQRIIKLMKAKNDLERALPKLHQFATVSDGAVMFDDTNKRRVKEFVQVLRTVESCLSALESLAEALEQTSPKSNRLKWLCSLGGGVPSDALDKLSFFLGEAFDLKLAETEGDIVPKEGAMPFYDEARSALQEIDDSLEAELNSWKKKLKDRSAKYYHRGKEPYQLEVKKETVSVGLPNEFELVSESKTTKRFYTNRIRKLVRDRVGAEEAFENESGGVARNIAAQFDKHYSTWASVSRACAEVDALIGLAEASRACDNGPMVRPAILPNDHPKAVFKARELRHPILARSENFVANDVSLGEGGETDVMILTGPNAGGKSTMARQVGLAVVLAQVGCFVPAQSLQLRPFQDIFVRMGASDEIARGRSTFMVEMEEVSHMLNNASPRSLIIADEVGRGTSTHDGHAIAFAVVDHIARTNKSLTIFSTHYSRLANDVALKGAMGVDRLRCGVYEMAAVIDERTKTITFLYKLTKGASSHSRGIYCARVAGVAGKIADAAEEAARKLNESMAQRASLNRVAKLIEGLNMSDDRVKEMLIKQSSS